MFKFLKSKKGDGSVVPIFIILAVTYVGSIIYFYKEIDLQIVNLQKQRYISAVNMAVKTAIATVELSDQQDYSYNTPGADEVTNLHKIALGYTVSKKMTVDKDKLLQVFYEVLWRNVYVYDSFERREAFKKYVPLKALVMNDTISLSTYPKNPGDPDVWSNYKIFANIGTAASPDYVYLTLSDEYYRLADTSNLNNYNPLIDEMHPDFLTVNSAFHESNKVYFTVDKSADSVPTPADQNTLSEPKYCAADNMTTERKNRLIAEYVQSSINAFVNSNKSNVEGYEVALGHYDETRILSAINDVTFFCLVEGIPIKSFLSKEADRTFYTFSFGGGSLRRADD